MFDAITTLQQLTQSSNGSGRLKAMIGAKNFAKSDEQMFVSFMFMRGAENKANYVKITLNGKDLYNVEFGKLTPTKHKIISNIEDMYAEDLRGYFEGETKLYLSL